MRRPNHALPAIYFIAGIALVVCSCFVAPVFESVFTDIGTAWLMFMSTLCVGVFIAHERAPFEGKLSHVDVATIVAIVLFAVVLLLVCLFNAVFEVSFWASRIAASDMTFMGVVAIVAAFRTAWRSCYMHTNAAPPL